MLLWVCSVIDGSQKTSACGKNIGDTLACGSCATSLFLPHFNVICDLLLSRRAATRNLFFKHISGTNEITHVLFFFNKMLQ